MAWMPPPTAPRWRTEPTATGCTSARDCRVECVVRILCSLRWRLGSCIGVRSVNVRCCPQAEVSLALCVADGENSGTGFVLGGLPPHVRGGSCSSVGCDCAYGFTPACAGRMAGRFRARTMKEVHPRMCGADAACKTLAPRVEGSLPHVRGGFIARLDAVDREWFTPACAGRMPTIFHRDACPKVHPRMWGADFRGLA